MRKPPAWLDELHRQWFAARGKQLGARTRGFRRDWAELLKAAKITSAEDEATAGREAVKLEEEGRLVLKRHRYRKYLIEGIELPVESEGWLRELFASDAPEDLQQRSLARVAEAAQRAHPRHPQEWAAWLAEIRAAFEAGKPARPLTWRHPELVGYLLDLTFRLTQRGWPPSTLVREASDALGLPSKELEGQRQIEACLGALLRRPGLTLDHLGIESSEPRVELAGDLRLHFADGSSFVSSDPGNVYALTTQLNRAVLAGTRATRILTVENRKTTLRRLAALNRDGSTLLIACAYPGRGLVQLLKLLPPSLPVFHFGDTDPAGFQILSKLRQALGRPVQPFLMHRREAAAAPELTRYDRGILPGLLEDPFLEDARPQLEAIATSGNKGHYEQESLGVPMLLGWPFYEMEGQGNGWSGENLP